MNGEWRTTRLRFLLESPFGVIYGATQSGIEFDPALPRYIRITDIRADGTLEPDNAVSLRRDISEPYMLKDRDILLARSGATVGKAFFYRADGEEACFAGYLIRARCDNRRILPEFLAYFFQSASYWNFVNQFAFQVTIQNVSAELYKELPVTHSNIARQKAVANFLDRQTAKIDRLIALRRRQMELLREQRVAVIEQAVTRGLDPDVPMKDSGLPWLGEIPAHWSVQRVKHVARFVQTGATPRSSEPTYYDLEGYSWYGPGDFGDALILGQSARFVSETAVHEGQADIFEPPTILLVGVGASVGKVGISVRPCFSNQQVNIIGLRPGYLTGYFGHFLAAYSWVIEANSNQATLPIFTQTQTSNFAVLVPPRGEQEAIVDFIDFEGRRLETLRMTYARQIELLTEYRAALIHECVTGQRVIGTTDVIPEAA